MLASRNICFCFTAFLLILIGAAINGGDAVNHHQGHQHHRFILVAEERSTTQNNSTLLSARTNLLPVARAEVNGAWQPTRIFGDDDHRQFLVTIGPSGGQKGYAGITGRRSWPRAFYVNGILIPELILERGTEYQFNVLAGNNMFDRDWWHPLYITTSPTGAFEKKNFVQQRDEEVFAGIVRTNGGRRFIPTGAGSLCRYNTFVSPQGANNYASFQDYKTTLQLHCNDGGNEQSPPLHRAAVLKFTPDASAPDIVWYQCYQAKNLGWRMRIVDDIEEAKRLLNGNGDSLSA